MIRHLLAVGAFNTAPSSSIAFPAPSTSGCAPPGSQRRAKGMGHENVLRKCAWHPRPQYLAVLQTEQGLSLTPSGLESSEAPQLAQTLGATMPLTTLHPPRCRHSVFFSCAPSPFVAMTPLTCGSQRVHEYDVGVAFHDAAHQTVDVTRHSPTALARRQ